MISVPIPTLGSPPAFTKTTADSDYNQARYCYEQSLLMYNLNQAGYTITQTETSDVTALEADFTSLGAYLKSWYDNNVNASDQGGSITALDKSYVPDLANFAFLAATGQWGLIFVLFVKVGLEFILDTEEKKLDPSLVSGDIAGILEKGLLDTNADGDKFSLLWALARQQIRIMLQKHGDFDDVILEDA